MILGERLKRLAAGKGIRVKELAYRLGVGAPHVSKMLLGRRQFTPEQLDKYIVAIGVEDPDAQQELHRHAAREYGFRIGE